MELLIRKGLDGGDVVLTAEISRYSYGDGRITATLVGGMVTIEIPYGSVVSIDITDPDNGNLSKICKYVSYNFVVYNDPKDGKNIIADNTMLFEILF